MAKEKKKMNNMYTVLPTAEQLDFWLDKGKNVLFHGDHGVGKTAIVKETFEKKNWKLGVDYVIFYGSTMDVWTDLIGIPVPGKDEDGNDIIKYCRPKIFSGDGPKAVFIDELNRAGTKTRNAIMELLQFKSVNGRKFDNLEIIWAAENPEDEEYDTESLDPAQKDRFHIHIAIPYAPDVSYFSKTFGALSAKSAIEWWNDLSEEDKRLVSPRRLEVAIDYHLNDGGNARDILPPSTNPAAFISKIQAGAADTKLKKFLKTQDKDGASQWLAIRNNLDAAVKHLEEDEAMREFFLPLIEAESLSAIISKNKEILDYIYRNPHFFKETILELCNSNNQGIRRRAEQAKKHFETLEAKGITEISIDKLVFNVPSDKLGDFDAKREYAIANFTLKSPKDEDCIQFKPSSDISSTDLLVEASELSFRRKNSVYMNQLINNFSKAAHLNMNKEEGCGSLDALNYIFSSNKINNILKHDNIDKVINTVLSTCMRDAKFNVELLTDRAPHFVNYLVDYITWDTDEKKFVDNLCIKRKDGADPFELNANIEIEDMSGIKI